jgi:hypothetical protein
MTKTIKYAIFCLLLITAAACSIKYSFSGSSIDYNKIKTFTIKEFPNQAALVYPPLSQEFTEALKDIYTRQTRLTSVKNNGDLELEGAIVGYDLAPMAVKEDAYASQTRLTITVKVTYTNRVNPDQDFTDQSFSAYREFSADKMLQDVQADLCEEIIDEIVDQIYNSTVDNW